MISGKKTSYDVSPVINGGAKAEVTIRKNSSNKFEFGLIKEDVLQESEIRVKMFDAGECSGIKKIQIWQSEEDKIEAVMVLTGRAEPLPMSPTKDKHYRKGDRITMKNFLAPLGI